MSCIANNQTNIMLFAKVDGCNDIVAIGDPDSVTHVIA